MLVLPGNKNQNKEKSKPKNEIMAKKLSKRQRKKLDLTKKFFLIKKI
jgi:hypothetical protein